MATEKDSAASAEAQAPATPPLPSKDGRKHRATYARDKRQGGYMVRIVGPHAADFRVGQFVPVTRMDGSEAMEQLNGLVWKGTDEESSQPCALHQMVKRARAEQELEF
jgi:hypothetical protein